MAARHGLGTYGNAVGTVTPDDHKLAQAGLVTKSAGNLIRPGLFYGGNATIVTGKANMSYDVAAFSGALTRGASSGAVLLSNDGVTNVVTTAAPGSNSRYDVVYVWQREYSLDGVDSNPVIGVVQGTAAASPTVPSLAAFPGALELARILVPAGVTATNSGTTITQTAPFTATAGGVVPVRNATERDAGTWFEPQKVWLIDSDKEQVYVNGSWLTTTPAISLMLPSSVANGTIVGDGAVTVSAAAFVTLNGIFTAAYDWYEIYFDLTTSAVAGLNGQLALLGTAIATAYDNQRKTAINATEATLQALNTTAMQFAPINLAAQHTGKLLLMNPAKAQATSGRALTFTSPPAALTSSGGISDVGVQHRTATAYDGFTITPSSGTITGTIRVIGVRNS
jgi:hypothetical protein